MLVIAQRIEPHWVAKDGKRFLTTSELVDRDGNSIGRRREVRGAIAAATARSDCGRDGSC